jgi:hypothetical protein
MHILILPRWPGFVLCEWLQLHHSCLCSIVFAGAGCLASGCMMVLPQGTPHVSGYWPLRHFQLNIVTMVMKITMVIKEAGRFPAQSMR